MTDFNIVLEPVAVALFKDGMLATDGNQPLDELHHRLTANPLLASIAISAKRQADALDLIAKHLAPVNVEVREETLPEGWHAHTGYAFPLAPGEAAQVRFRNGTGTKVMTYPEAATLSWVHGNTDLDIVAYRVVT